jgi:endonuclease-3
MGRVQGSGSKPIAARVAQIFTRLDKTHADATLALDFENPLELLIALILAAQCTDAKVNEVTPALFKRYPRAADFANASQEDMEEAVRPTGFYRQKAKAVRTCCQQLVERHHGEVPEEMDALLALSGVGRKTANILRGNAFGLPGIGVDTHVSRLSQRLGLTRATDPDKIEADLVRIVPATKQIRFCHLLQFHGRRTCFARKPDCPHCVIIDLCPFTAKTPAPTLKKPPKRSQWVK